MYSKTLGMWTCCQQTEIVLWSNVLIIYICHIDGPQWMSILSFKRQSVLSSGPQRSHHAVRSEWHGVFYVVIVVVTVVVDDVVVFCYCRDSKKPMRCYLLVGYQEIPMLCVCVTQKFTIKSVWRLLVPFPTRTFTPTLMTYYPCQVSLSIMCDKNPLSILTIRVFVYFPKYH